MTNARRATLRFLAEADTASTYVTESAGRIRAADADTERPPAPATIPAPRCRDEPTCTIDTVFDGEVDHATTCFGCDGTGAIIVAHQTPSAPSESAPCPYCDGGVRY